MFSHHQLKVYDHALTFAAAAADLSLDWPKTHAVVDQLQRASESTVVNIAEAARLRSIPIKQRSLDYAIGSALECAACLDIAFIKGLLPTEPRVRELRVLSQMVKMMIGLRKSWEPDALGEDSVAYGDNHSEKAEILFHHESLDVYQTALSFIRWFHFLPKIDRLASRLNREIDAASTSMTLNVAEGNGRYFKADQRKFLEIAHRSTVKTATYLDLGERRGELAEPTVHPGKELLGRVSAMLDRMTGN